MQIADNHIKRSSVSFVIRKTHPRSPVRCHYTTTIMDKLKTFINFLFIPVIWRTVKIISLTLILKNTQTKNSKLQINDFFLNLSNFIHEKIAKHLCTCLKCHQMPYKPVIKVSLIYFSELPEAKCILMGKYSVTYGCVYRGVCLL